MNSLVALIESFIENSFKVDHIKDKGCQIDISMEEEPRIVIRFCPGRPNFGPKAKEKVKSPDFLFVSDHPIPNGRLFVIELIAYE